MKEFILKLRAKYPWIKYVFEGLGAILIIYCIVLVCTPRPRLVDSKIIYQKIDSLGKANNALMRENRHLDSVTVELKNQLDTVNIKLNNIQGVKILTKEYYHDLIEKSKTYTPSQIDSFFKNRYKYP